MRQLFSEIFLKQEVCRGWKGRASANNGRESFFGSGLVNVMLGSNAGADFLPDFLLGSVWTFCLTGSAAMHRQPAQEKPAREKQGKQ